MKAREFYPDNLKLIFLENLVPIGIVTLLFFFQGRVSRTVVTFCFCYYALAFFHYLYIQVLKIDEEYVQGPVSSLLWRVRIPWSRAIIFEEKVFSFRLIRIQDSSSQKSIIFFTNYYKPSTIREVENLLYSEREI